MRSSRAFKWNHGAECKRKWQLQQREVWNEGNKRREMKQTKMGEEREGWMGKYFPFVLCLLYYILALLFPELYWEPYVQLLETQQSALTRKTSSNLPLVESSPDRRKHKNMEGGEGWVESGNGEGGKWAWVQLIVTIMKPLIKTATCQKTTEAQEHQINIAPALIVPGKMCILLL